MPRSAGLMAVTGDLPICSGTSGVSESAVPSHLQRVPFCTRPLMQLGEGSRSPSRQRGSSPKFRSETHNATSSPPFTLPNFGHPFSCVFL